LRKSKEEAVAEALLQCNVLPIKTVARNLACDYPHYFKGVEAARSALRFKRGANGDHNRGRMGITEPQLSTIAEGLAKYKGVRQVTETPLLIDSDKLLVLSDIHFPYQDDTALGTALEYGQKYGPDHIHLNGDIIDFYGCSRFNKDPRAIPIYRELEIANQFLDDLQAWFPNATISFKYGNHEIRLGEYIRNNAAAIEGMKGVTVHEQLGLDERGIEWRKIELAYAGKLTIMHGHERKTPFNNIVNPSTTLLRWAFDQVILGHHHQTSEIVRRKVRGELLGAWSTGCLCGLRPEYDAHNLTHNHGFATVDFDTDGAFEVNNHKIIDGRVR
jgi:predicted phosphodiesterase